MAVTLDHIQIPSSDKSASADLIAYLFNVGSGPANAGPFIAVHISESLTLDFDEWTDPIPQLHYCFRVNETEFNEILERLTRKAIPFRSTPHGPVDRKVNTEHGGKIVYWNEPDNHIWEMLTVSYARNPS